MSSKILLRRGTAAQWTSANPTLGVGELGIETDTLKIKVGNGSSTWTQLTNYINVTPSGLSNSLGDYILLANQGNAGGPAELDSNGNLLIPENSAIFWNDPAYSYTTTLTTTQPTENRVITFPNATGTVALTSDITSAVTNLINAAPSTLDTLNELAAAINNDSSFSTTVNNLLNGKVSKSGDTITIPTTSAVGLIIKGASGQAANLQEWQRSDGFVLLNVSKDGDVTAGTGSSTAIRFRYFDGINITGTYWDTVQTNSATFIGRSTTAATMVVRGAASQTANLQEWQDSSGTILARVNSAGNIYTSGYLTAGVQSPTGTLTVVSKGVSVPVAVIKGAASQTANLQEWQDSTGSLLGFMNAYGTLTANNRMYAGWAAFGSGFGTLASASNVVLIAKGAASQTADLQQWQDSSGNVQAKITAYGDIYTLGGRIFRGSQDLGANVNILVSSSTQKGIVVQGAASQTANLQEWQNSAGNVLTKIASDGTIVSYGSSLNAFQSIGTSTTLYNGITVQNSTGASAFSLGTAGTSESAFDVANSFYIYDGIAGIMRLRLNSSGLVGINAVPTSQLQVNNSTAANVGLIVKGAASQTANLQEWQDSAGTVLAKVTATGKLDITPSSGNTINFRNSSGGLTLWGGNSSYFMNTGLYMTGGSWAAGRLGIDTQGASNIGLVVRGAASQTANLQEWQDSAGTIKSYIASDGSFSSSMDATINSLTIGRGGGNQISNVAIGLAALLSNTTGVGNTQIGLSSGQNITTGSYNVGVGNYTNLSLTTGISNTSIGTSAGSTITTGSNITVLGYDAEPSSPTISNEITLGNASVTKLRIPGIGVDWTSSALNIGSDRVLTSQDEKNIYITDSGTARTLGSSDAYKILEFTSSSSITVTIPNDASDTTFPIGSYVEVRQMGGGQITVSATSPATLVATDNQYKTRVQYSAIILEKRASNAWYLAGDTTA